jgi:hypothetical protein
MHSESRCVPRNCRPISHRPLSPPPSSESAASSLLHPTALLSSLHSHLSPPPCCRFAAACPKLQRWLGTRLWSRGEWRRSALVGMGTRRTVRRLLGRWDGPEKTAAMRRFCKVPFLSGPCTHSQPSTTRRLAHDHRYQSVMPHTNVTPTRPSPRRRLESPSSSPRSASPASPRRRRRAGVGQARCGSAAQNASAILPTMRRGAREGGCGRPRKGPSRRGVGTKVAATAAASPDCSALGGGGRV